MVLRWIRCVLCGLVAVCFLANPKEDNVTEPFGKIYQLEETVYVYGKQLISSVAYPILMEDSVSYEVDWTRLYETLPAGKYRLIKEIHDFRGTGNYDIEEFYVDFVIQ